MSQPGPHRRPRRRHRPNTTAALATASAVATKPKAPVQESPAALQSDAEEGPLFSTLAQQDILHPTLYRAVDKDLGYTVMSPVQAATLEPILRGQDCLTLAKTGTGKTLAFLLPAVQTLLLSPPSPRPSVRAVIVSPTRELARQIAAEAQVLLTNIPNIRVYTSVGGTNMNEDKRNLLRHPDLLVATPGRLNDHLSSPELRGCFQHLAFFVLDEADRLVDEGFFPVIQQIMKALPPSQRQTLLFSATMPQEVTAIATGLLKPGYAQISTIPVGDVGVHERVPQSLLVSSDVNAVLPLTLAALKREHSTSLDTFKSMLFCPTARQAQLYAEVLQNLSLPYPVFEIHSRMTQSRRERVTKDFRAAQFGLLCSSDVTARGMDFPDVSHVFQVGLPSSREQYIHRIGRTARAGKDGKGILILAPFETKTKRARALDGLPLETENMVPTAEDTEAIRRGMTMTEKLTRSRCYKAWLGYYRPDCNKTFSPESLVREANAFAVGGMLLEQPPSIWTGIVGKMNLKGVPGLRLTKDRNADD